ncbi:cysteine desulfurase family protein [Vagococcus xieshaowenii]|uniref:cysteine desulfurase n=1 Tax=Vagococcus xieshaowenii TaxID=2562451 RepID=A0AAJ5JLZ8_9ENTE|nr:cysteine desulfurase family protein [Vagococcus xieshaowenii]QCA28902.1 cysteine desulfurase [Vagococcus xieshaowenii]TFZ43320.1 cysteine desulfurase [Vagococcus xieshaowenii]
MKPVYLDHAATTPLHPEVIQTMTKTLTETFGNPSSLHQFGRPAQGLLENARDELAKSIGAKPSELIFTSGGSEGDTMAIIKTAENYQHLGKHLITTQVEHSAVLKSFKYLETQGFEVTYLPVASTGELTVEQVNEALREDTILVSIMRTNNEVGTIFPIPEIGALLQTHQALFHTDAVQSFGLEEIDVNAWHVDLLSTAAHKINGPKGTGFLFIKEGTKITPLIHGGDQENKKRPGTENLANIMGYAKAASLLTPEKKKDNQRTYQAYREIILSTLSERAVAFDINGQAPQQSAHVLNLYLPGVQSEMLLMHLDLKGFAVSAGSACTAGNMAPSHVLIAMHGKDSAIVPSSIRISFGLGLSEEDVRDFAETLADTVLRMTQH